MDESPEASISGLNGWVRVNKGGVVAEVENDMAANEGGGGAELNVGDIAPAFELPSDGGGKVSFSPGAGNATALFFYPQDNTPTCTTEAISFSAAKPEFDRIGIALIGISPDSRKRHDQFKQKHALTVDLGADEERNAIDAYGVWAQKTTFGRTYMGVVRTTFLIGRDGRIARIWRNVRIKGHVEEVLEAAKAL